MIGLQVGVNVAVGPQVVQEVNVHVPVALGVGVSVAVIVCVDDSEGVAVKVSVGIQEVAGVAVNGICDPFFGTKQTLSIQKP